MFYSCRNWFFRPDDGLLLGDGNLFISVYQTVDRIVWRFSKGDAWDGRLHMSDDPKPTHITGIVRGIQLEDWKCLPYGTTPAVAKRGIEKPERMQEFCQGSPPSDRKRNTPATLEFGDERCGVEETL